MDESLYGTSFWTQHTEGIDILAIVQVTQCAVLLVQPVLQGLEGFFSWTLIFVYRLRVDEGEVCNPGQMSAFVSLIMPGKANLPSIVFWIHEQSSSSVEDGIVVEPGPSEFLPLPTASTSGTIASATTGGA
ncbi:hypothetical protein FJTKL_12903 [Diaporthe vaccinii]|uniref:Uncharacterized protein n=1 Tax=Diaporthe vaccinii TaxID=105482 RepID=A0ABR4F9Z2_9PEZI